MTEQGPVSGWATEVIDFLSCNLPSRGHSKGWDHKSSTAYEIGCEALVALGYAEETKWGAKPLADPKCPSTLPRWDDICVAVLGLAQQQNKLSYLWPDDNEQRPRSGYVVTPLGSQPTTLQPNISSTIELGPAYAASDSMSVLLALGLIDRGRWTNHAETILWREQPRAWDLDYTADPRFEAAAQVAVDTVPNDIRKEIARLVVISDDDVEASIAQHKSAIEGLRRQYGPKVRIDRLRTPEETRRSLALLRRSELDWVFFRRWRLPDGWLNAQQAVLALEIFHDPLAIHMRRIVTGSLYPDLPEFSE